MSVVSRAFGPIGFGRAAALVGCWSGCVPMDDLSSYAAGSTEQASAPELAASERDALGDVPPSTPAELAAESTASSTPAPPAPANPTPPVTLAAADDTTDDGAAFDASPAVARTVATGSASRFDPTDAGLRLDAGAVARSHADPAPGFDAGLAEPAPRVEPPVLADRPRLFIGATRHAVHAAGLERSFIYYAPANLDPNVPAPVVIVAHGVGQSAADMFDITRFDSVADREGFVVLYPDGQGRVPWNIGADVCHGPTLGVASAGGDDSALVDAMLALVASDRRVDEAHVFMSGLASGAYLANELGCQRADIRAVVAHSGGSHALASCASGHKPVLLLHGLADRGVPAGCSVQARDRWVAHNGCGASVSRLAARGGSCDLSLECPEDGQVMLCQFEGMGQGWAGGSAQSDSFLNFTSASELSWAFFKVYAW